MTTALVRSVNVGLPRVAAWTAIGRTSIDKRPVGGPVRVERLGLAGDAVSNTRHHGGPDQAVYAYAREDLDRWAAELGVPVPDGQFAENLTTQGLDVNQAEIGERWRVGGAEGALLEVASVRTPCATFRSWMGRSGYDERTWVRRFAEAALPGPYLRVLVPGSIAAGDDLDVVHRPGHGVTVADVFRALHGDRSLLADVAAVEALQPRLRERARDLLRQR